MSFSENLRKYRERAKYSSKELADTLKIKYTTYLNYENAGAEPRYEILMKIADTLDVSLDDLLGYTKQENRMNNEELLKELMEKDAENKRNALIHLTKALSYAGCGVIDMEYDQEEEIVIVTFESGVKRVANVEMDSTAAMMYDIFKQINWLR